jgi:hypothetical protein
MVLPYENMNYGEEVVTGGGGGGETLSFVNSILTSGNGSVIKDEFSSLVTYTPPDLSVYAPLAGATFTGDVTFSGDLSVTGGSSIDVMGADYNTLNSAGSGLKRGIYLNNNTDTAFGLYMSHPTAGKALNGGYAIAGYGFPGLSIRMRTLSNWFNGILFENTNGDLLFSIRASDGLGYIRGNLFCNGALRFPSDDRLKFDETDLTDGLSVIRQLEPQVYMKSKELNVQKDLRKEIGLIAQQIQAIPQLAHTVEHEPENPDGALNVDYTQIFVYTIQAIKELDAMVRKQQETINLLMEQQP